MTLVDHIWWQISKPVNHQFHTTVLGTCNLVSVIHQRMKICDDT